LGVLDIPHRILLIPGAAARGKGHSRGVITYGHEETERCQVGNIVFTEARHPGDRTGHYTANEQFVDRLLWRSLRVDLHLLVSFSGTGIPVARLIFIIVNDML